MKITNLSQLMVLGVVLAVTAVGCKTHPQGVTHIGGNPNNPRDQGLGNMTPFNPGPAIGGGDTVGRDVPLPPGGSHSGWAEDRSSLSAQAVYFDLDKSTIKNSEQGKLNEVANYLKGNGSAALRIEGNCDERGTEEYNRALGDKRALSAREYLVNLGVDSSKIETLSNGEDKPAVQGHGESAWGKNRRDEFVVLTPPKP